MGTFIARLEAGGSRTRPYDASHGDRCLENCWRKNGHHFGHVNANARAFAFAAANIHGEIGAVKNFQALVNVADANSLHVNLRHAHFGNSHAVIFNFNLQAAVIERGADADVSAFQFSGEAVLQRIFHDGLEHHAGNEGVESSLINLLKYLEIFAAETDDFDIEIVVDEIKFFTQRDECFVFAQQAAKNVAEFYDDDARHIGIEANQGRDGVQRVEQKMRINLAGERVHARFQQKLLMLLEIHFHARVIPNFYGHGHGHHRGDENCGELPEASAVNVKKPVRVARINFAAEKNASGFEKDDDGHGQKRPRNFAIAQKSHEQAAEFLKM